MCRMVLGRVRLRVLVLRWMLIRLIRCVRWFVIFVVSLRCRMIGLFGRLRVRRMLVWMLIELVLSLRRLAVRLGVRARLRVVVDAVCGAVWILV